MSLYLFNQNNQFQINSLLFIISCTSEILQDFDQITSLKFFRYCRLKIDLFFFQIIFRFEMGTGFGSSAALDDIITRDGPCN